MGEVLNFAECKAARADALADARGDGYTASEAEYARYHTLRGQGYDDETALEIIVMSRHILGSSNGD